MSVNGDFANLWAFQELLVDLSLVPLIFLSRTSGHWLNALHPMSYRRFVVFVVFLVARILLFPKSATAFKREFFLGFACHSIGLDIVRSTKAAFSRSQTLRKYTVMLIITHKMIDIGRRTSQTYSTDTFENFWHLYVYQEFVNVCNNCVDKNISHINYDDLALKKKYQILLLSPALLHL